MEQSEGFKRLATTIKTIENQLSLCGDSIQVCENSAIEAEKIIEEHFAKYMNALASRKAVLLKDIENKVLLQKESVEETRVKLETSLTACKQTLSTGSLLYASNKSIAETLWKDITSIPLPQRVDVKISIALQSMFMEAIQTHGKVEIGTRTSATVPSLLVPPPSTSPSPSTPSTPTTPHSPSVRATVSPPSASLSSSSIPLPSPTTRPASLRNRNFTFVENVTTIAGSERGSADGTGKKASFNSPSGMCFNSRDECLYICDADNNSIRKLTLAGEVTTFVNSASGLNKPNGIVVYLKENTFFVTNYKQHTVSRITSGGVMNVFAGNGKEGNADGVGKNATFTNPSGIAIDQQTGTIFVCANGVIRKVSPQGEVSTLAGDPTCGYEDGNGKAARFRHPCGLYFDESARSLVVCDYGNNRLRRIQLNGEVSTICFVERPVDVTMTANRTLLVSSIVNQIYKVKQSGQNYEAVAIAGHGNGDKVDGKADECTFNCPRGMAIHEGSHSCFVADVVGDSIRKITFVDSM